MHHDVDEPVNSRMISDLLRLAGFMIPDPKTIASENKETT